MSEMGKWMVHDFLSLTIPLPLLMTQFSGFNAASTSKINACAAADVETSNFRYKVASVDKTSVERSRIGSHHYSFSNAINFNTML